MLCVCYEHTACLVHSNHRCDRKEARRDFKIQQEPKALWARLKITEHYMSPAFRATRTPRGMLYWYWYFHKNVLLLACPPALVTSVWLQQSPFMSWLCLLHFVWLTSGLCLPAGHRLTLSSTSLPERPVNEVNVPPSLVRGWHMGIYNALCNLP